jgi:hypothetical protein
MAKGMSKTGLSKEHMIEALVAQNLGIECVVKKPLLQLEEEEELLEEVATEGAEDSEWSDEEGDVDVTSVNGLLWFAGLELTLSMLSQDPELKAHQVRYSVLQAKAETGLVSRRMVGCSGLLEETQRLLVKTRVSGRVGYLRRSTHLIHLSARNGSKQLKQLKSARKSWKIRFFRYIHCLSTTPRES